MNRPKLVFNERALKSLIFIWIVSYCSILLTIQNALAQEDILDFVPAETPYLMRYHADDRITQLMELSVADSISEKQIIQEYKPLIRMYALLIRDLVIHVGTRSEAKLGLRPINQLQLGVYGLGIWPVITVSMSDSDRVKRWIATLAQKSGLTYESHDKIIRFKVKVHPSIPGSFVLTFSGDKWAHFAYVPEVFSQEMIPYLTGDKAPKISMSKAHTFNTWTQEAGVSPTSAIWIGIERITQTLLGHGKGINNRLRWFDDSLTQSISKDCVQELIEMSAQIPYVVSGERLHDSHNEYHSRVMFKFSDPLAKIFETLSSEGLYLTPTKNTFINGAISLDMRAIFDVVQQLLNGRLQKPFKCDVLLKAGLTSQQLQKVSAQLTLAPSFINDINGMSFSVYDIEPNPKGIAIISVNDLSNLINIFKSMNPNFSQIQLPKIGEGPKKIQGLPTPSQVDLQVELQPNALGISVGEGMTQIVSQILKNPPSKNPPTLSVGYHLGRLTEAISNFLNKAKQAAHKIKEIKYQREVQLAKMKGLPPPLPPKDETDSSGSALGMKIGAFQNSLRFTKQGLELNITLKLHQILKK